ncbi:hypothetical protein JEP93_21540 [Serratia marcescens]|nr:hypothetical protein [Serratia marcescens]
MVSFSNMDGAHCDSVVDHYTLPSNSIQMDVKVPVQPSNFDPLQKGALMGASTFMEQDKNHSNQCNYKTKSIPSPGTIFREPSLWLGFCFSGTGLSIELRSIIRPKASPYGPALKRCSTRRQRRLSKSGRPIQKNPPMAGFSLSGVRTLHRTAFDYSAKGLTLRVSAKALFNPAPAPVVRVRSPYSEEPAR